MEEMLAPNGHICSLKKDEGNLIGKEFFNFGPDPIASDMDCGLNCGMGIYYATEAQQISESLLLTHRAPDINRLGNCDLVLAHNLKRKGIIGGNNSTSSNVLEKKPAKKRKEASGVLISGELSCRLSDLDDVDIQNVRATTCDGEAEPARQLRRDQ